MNWTMFFYLLGAAVLAWYGISWVRRNPGSLSRTNIGKSIYVLGILALILIAVVVVCLKIIQN